ncbi:MAG: serine protease [Bdellovibrionales bacterium]
MGFHLKLIHTIAICIISFSFQSQCDAAQGFLQIKDLTLPTAVRQTAPSVFRVYYLAGTPTIFDLTQSKVPEMTDENYLTVTQLLVCEKQNLTKCPVLSTEYSGTAFLLRDQHTIATNLHNVQDWLHHALINNPGYKPHDITPPIFIVNNREELVYSPLEHGYARLSFYDSQNQIFASPFRENPTDGLMRSRDYVELRLQEAIPLVPLQEASPYNIFLQELKYSIGYPSATHQYSQFDLMDSNGQSQFASTGFISSTFSTAIGPWVFDIAAAPGSSGSPLLNSNGEVIGILCGGSTQKTESGIIEHTEFLPVSKRHLLTHVEVVQLFGAIKNN